MDDTHDKLAQTYLNYFEANEKFEKRPSERTKRAARRELRILMVLAKQRQDEILSTYQEVLDDMRANNKWQSNRRHQKSKKAQTK